MPANNVGMNIGQVMREIREAQGATLEDVALAAGTNASNLSRIERGRQGYSEEMLVRIASALGVSVSDLYRRVESSDSKSRPDRSAPRKGDAANTSAVMSSYEALEAENRKLVQEFVKLLLRRQRSKKG